MENKKTEYSVLMSVYYKEKPEFLRQSMMSIFDQTVPTNDFVLVCDGDLTDGLNSVIDEMKAKFGDILNVVRLPQNVGLGKALNEGINHCKNDLVARMDSDDISFLNRCEKQLAIFDKMHDVSIVGGTIEEFSVTPDNIDSRRVVPETNKDIISFAKNRCPFNHPCIMYRRKAVHRAGGYQDFYLLEDYYLWIRMLMNGSVGYNIQEPILWMRAGNGMYKRRSGLKYAKSQIALFKFMREKHFISNWQYVKSVAVRFCSSVAPNFLRKFMYEKILRK